MNKYRHLLLFGAIAISFALGFSYLYQIKDNPFFHTPQKEMDMYTYHNYAVGIVEGRGWPEIIHYSPLYPFVFLPMVYLLFGVNPVAVYIIQIIMGALCIFITYLIARRFFGTTVAIVSAYMHCLYGVFVVYYGVLLAEVLLNLLVLLSIYVFLIALDNKNLKYQILCGLLFGLSALAKPTILAFIPFLIIPLFVKRGINKKAVTDFLLIVLFSGFTILPVTIRNYRLTGGFFPVSSGGPIVFLMGNVPDTTGVYFYTPQVNKAMEETEGMSLVERNRFYNNKTIGFIKEDIPRSLGIFWKKFLIFWGGWHVSNNVRYYPSYYSLHRNNVVRPTILDFPLLIPWELLTALGITGIFISLGMWRKALVLYLFVFIYSAVIISCMVLGRFRLPIFPVLAIFSGVTVRSLVKLFYHRRFLKGVCVTAMAASILFIEYGYAQAVFFPSGIYKKTDEFVIVRDEKMRITDVEDVNCRTAAYKELVLNLDPAGYSKVWMGYFISIKTYGYMKLIVNGKVVGTIPVRSSVPGDYGYPFVFMDFPVSFLKRGRNAIVIAPLDEAEVFFYVDSYAKYGRSWVLNRDNENEKKVRGEFVIRLELQK